MPAPNSAPPTDAELVAGLRAGDRRAWRTLLDRYERSIFAVARRMGLSAEDSADVLQDVLASLLTGLDRLRTPAALPGWLLRAAYRIALRKRALGRRESAPTDEAFWDRVVDPVPEPLEVVARIELGLRVRAAVKGLGGRCAALLEALFLEEPRPSYEELAARLSLPIGSLGPTRLRCLDRLWEELERAGIKPIADRTSPASRRSKPKPKPKANPRRGAR